MLKNALRIAVVTSLLTCISAHGAPIRVEGDFGKFKSRKGTVVISGDSIRVNGKSGYITPDRRLFDKRMLKILNLQKKSELEFNQYLLEKSETFSPLAINSFVLTQTGWKFNEEANLGTFSAEQLEEFFDLQRYLTGLYKKQNEEARRCIAALCLGPKLMSKTAQEEDDEEKRRAKIKQEAMAAKEKIRKSQKPEVIKSGLIEEIEWQEQVDLEYGR